jgi:error-prone DNA polymerase
MYAELVCQSNFSFLRGASHPEELVHAAKALGVSALALGDHDGLYGMVKAHLAAKAVGLRLLVASRLHFTDAPPLVLLPQDAAGYAQLCRLISLSRLQGPRGKPRLQVRSLLERSEGLWAVLPEPADAAVVAPVAEAFPGRFYVGVQRELCAGDEARVEQALSLARTLEVPACAHNDVHLHARARKPLLDVLWAIRHGVPLSGAGTRLLPNAERCLKGPEEMLRLFSDLPELVGRTLEVVDSCRFSLDELRYHFSEELLPPGQTPMGYLRELVEQGMPVRYPAGVPAAVRAQVEHELRLIGALDFPGYFLAIWDIVRFARERGILCQGRGSAANSVVCYLLQITAIDPVRMGLLFERFLSMERREPPDIDVDFEHERREEVLQYVYEKHGRHRAAMVCEVICYRGRLAAREVGKALGLSLDQVDRLARTVDFGGGVSPDRLAEAGLSAADGRVQKVLQLSGELEGFPRHLSIHVGGFVITREPVMEVIPVESAAMKDRTVVQWEKDDLNAVGILKVDLLGLGMLTVLSRCFRYVAQAHGDTLSLATLPPEDPRVYDMLCEADTMGVFQIESRAQMNMLPRLRPRTFYDLVVEIALIRPGPIVGQMVHPYLRRRDGLETVEYPSEEVRGILEKTLGVPLFQEQAMRLAMVAGGFSAAEADGLRRAMTHKRAEEQMAPWGRRFVEGCMARGYSREFADRCFQQFRGFSHYGFPESHSASFALIAYASAYLKRYYPAAFCAALINSQPMGFYAVHSLVEDARRHGVEVLPLDVQCSDWDCTLEPGTGEDAFGRVQPKLRLGLRLVKGLQEAHAQRLVAARGEGYRGLGDLARRARIPSHELARLALAGALKSLCGSRREALWELQALGPLDAGDLFFGMPLDGTQVELPLPHVADEVAQDYETTGLSLDHHPFQLLRPQLERARAVSAAGLAKVASGRAVRTAGMVICRQRPPTAKGFTFLSLEDETGISNVVVKPDDFTRYRKEILGSPFLLVEGVVERAGKVVNVKVKELRPLWLETKAPAARR